jgi:type I restriction enzyme S subunit
MTELGPLPEEWEVVLFNEAIARRPRVPKVKRSACQSIGSVPVVDQGQSLIAGYVDDIRPYEGELPVIVFGDHTRALKFVDFPFVAGADGTQVLVPNRRHFDPYFLYCAFMGTEIPSRGYNRHFNLLREKSFPKPSLPEQRAIAHVLRTVQRAKEAKEGIIAALKELRKSLMRHLFTYGPVPVGQADQVPLKETEVGPLPEEWQVVRLEDVVCLGSEAVNPTHVAAGRYVGLEHIEPGSTRIQKWGHPSEVRSLKTAFRPGDVLYGKLRPYLDKAALAEWEGICSTDILVLRAQNGLEPDFLAYLAHTHTFFEYAIATMTGVNHPRTSWKALQQLQVPLPPLPEQRAIAGTLRTVDRKIEAEESRKRALEALFKTLLHHLMTGKVRVKGFHLPELERTP